MKKIMCFVIIGIMMISSNILFVSAYSPWEIMGDIEASDGSGKYERYFIDYLKDCYSSSDTADLSLYYYDELYEYSSSPDCATPDYVLVEMYSKYYDTDSTCMVLGDYVVEAEITYMPYQLALYVFLPAEEKVLKLHEAVNQNIPEIDNIFTQADIGRLIGDMDKDRKLTVKDATYIQKCLAGILEFAENDRLRGWTIPDVPDNKTPFYISDFNRDGERNIKDATAIQKKIAGLPY